MKRVTMKDIAQRLGLSINTVSHAINDREDISKATKLKVRQTAKEMGYLPNLSARGLRQGLTRMVAILYDNLLNPYYSVMTMYLNECLSQHGYSFMTFTSKHFDKKSLDSMSMRGVDGIISFLEPYGIDETNIAIPSLLLGRRSDVTAIDCVRSDDVEGGALAARWLVGKGCKKVLFIGENEDISCLNDRLVGFTAECEKSGVRAEKFMLEGRSLHAVADEVCAALQGCDGVFCFNDLLAFELRGVLKNKKADKLYIVGYDDLLSEICLPCAVTSVGCDKKRMAELAADRLTTFMKSGARVPGDAPIVPVRLTEREDGLQS